MNPMNIGMGGMNAMPGGPVGGVPMMNSASAAPRNEPPVSQESLYTQLNTCIYDYFLKRGQFDAARMLLSDENVKLDTDMDPKTSPNHMNGADGDSSMTDGKDEKIKIPDEFPRPRVPMDSANSFLLDWFSMFWDIFMAQRKRGTSNPMTQQFVQHTQNLMRMREQANQQILRQPQMMMQNQMLRRNGMQGVNLQKAALQNNTSTGMTPQQMAQFQNKQMQMQREHSDMDMNGHRPQSPSSAENAPSPSKRPRLEGAQAGGQQMAPNGRGQGQMPAQLNTQAMLMQNGINPRGMNPAQFQAFQQSGQAAQQKSIQVYAQNLALHHSRSAMNNQGMPNGLMNTGLMPNQNDMMPQLPDGQGITMMNGQFYNGEMGTVPRNAMANATGQSGNHALQDYQMQLMLLEQQNKRRLMMARQEQDSMGTRSDGQPMSQLPPGTSPQGSRAGASPNPSEQMKRGTPKIPQTGLPGSPSAGDLQGRGSPASMNFNGGQIPPDMNNAFFMKPDAMVGGPNGMRPPTSNQGFNPQMGQAMQPGPNNRMPSGNWQTPQAPQGQQMVPQQSPAPQAAPTPQERNAMPPPSAPPAGGNKPASPSQGAAPPTPQQSNKPAPKKKDTEKNRKRPTKKAAAVANANTAATPSSEAEPPPTPTPPTPITPQHASSFNKNVANATTAAPQQPTSAPAPPMVQQQPDPNPAGFGDIGMPDPSGFNLDFSALENSEILENFDFDSFLNTDGDTAGFGFDPSIGYSGDGVETSTDGL